MFIDATYEGDLIAAAGVDYHVGREANAVYGESWNGVQIGTLHHGHWGLPLDEYTDNANWSPQLYIREGRRMIGAAVMTEHEVLNRRAVRKPVGMGSYALDSHNVQRYITPDGFVQNEGDIGVRAPRPYGIDYDCLVPRRDQARNLLVPVCVSSSHTAFGSIRMEPVFMVLGQSAATAACLALDAGLPVQDVDYALLKQQLLQDGQILQLAPGDQSG